MAYNYLAAPVRGIFRRALSVPRIGALGGALLLAGLIGMLSVFATGTARVNASGTCTPNTSYTTPATLPLSRDGLTVIDDGVATYGIGGGDVATIRTALNRCAPSFMGAHASGEFLAYTSYALNWDYAAEHTSATTCRLTDVRVGLHLAQLLPRLETRNSTVLTKWSQFITGLQAHEDGHKAIDRAQAESLIGALQSLSAPCSTIEARANKITTDATVSLVAANADHDTVTDYGRDQGARW